MDDLIARARAGNAKAIAALEAARYLGIAIASIINAVDLACVYVGGEITAAWGLIAGSIRTARSVRLWPSAP